MKKVTQFVFYHCGTVTYSVSFVMLNTEISRLDQIIYYTAAPSAASSAAQTASQLHAQVHNHAQIQHEV